MKAKRDPKTGRYVKPQWKTAWIAGGYILYALFCAAAGFVTGYITIHR